MEKFDKKDAVNCENLIKAIKKAKFELDGMEVLAMAEVFKWVGSLHARIQHEVSEAEKPKPLAVKQEQVPVVTEPETVKQKVTQEVTKKPKKSKQ